MAQCQRGYAGQGSFLALFYLIGKSVARWTWNQQINSYAYNNKSVFKNNKTV